MSACVTAPPTLPPQGPTPDERPAFPGPPDPTAPQPLPQNPGSRPFPEIPSPSTVPSGAEAFSRLPGWSRADVRPAVRAFARNCEVWAKKNAGSYLKVARPDLGRIADWQAGCGAATSSAKTAKTARRFFETYFYPQTIRSNEASTGLITGYFQPEIAVRRRATAEFSEPILTRPKTEAARRLPRAKVTGGASDIIAYGRPLEVFFMHIQGSGVLIFKDGHRVRAAYAANNGLPYTSIGGVLVRAGYMNTEQASKQAIEEWMVKSGPQAARMLMNENKRYIYFAPENLVDGEGPKGAMTVPLTAMGSLAVDPSFHPYGVPVWLNVKLPKEAGDYRGIDTGLLVVAQDTGSAIRGLLRGDLYFGSGDDAGARAGVMKHPGTWTVLLPISLIPDGLIS